MRARSGEDAGAGAGHCTIDLADRQPRSTQIVIQRKDVQPSEPKRTQPAIAVLVSMLLCYSAGFLGSLATNQGLVGWYLTAQRPTFEPPLGLFVPMWTILYGVLGWAGYRAYALPSSGVRSLGMILIAALAASTSLWSWTFFGWHRLPVAFVLMVVVVAFAAAALVVVARLERRLGLLILPLLAWALYLSMLSYSVWKLNPNLGIPQEAIPPSPARSR